VSERETEDTSADEPPPPAEDTPQDLPDDVPDDWLDPKPFDPAGR
jgi:hypothetical protein